MKDEMDASQIKKEPAGLRERTRDFALRIIRLY
jgi:hypothetical protein